jgi:hypothetical protein
MAHGSINIAPNNKKCRGPQFDSISIATNLQKFANRIKAFDELALKLPLLVVTLLIKRLFTENVIRIY